MAIEFEMKTLSVSPPGGWEYTVKQTGFTAKHFDFQAFTKQLREHCIANAISLEENWKERVVDEMIKAKMDLWHPFVKRVGKQRVRKGMSFGAIMSGLNVLGGLLQRKVEGEETRVPQEEAERRASICATCDYNTKQISFSCGGCASAFGKTLKLVVGEMHTEYDLRLGSCSICSCTLKAAVHVPLKLQQDVLSEEVKALFRDPHISAYCWKARNL